MGMSKRDQTLLYSKWREAGGIVVRQDELRAVAMAAADQDIRFYLEGVKVEVCEKDVIFVATNGHLMAAFRINRHPSVSYPQDDFIIPRCLLRYMRGPGPVRIACDGGFVTLETSDMVYGAKGIEGKFPDWRKVVPRAPSGQGSPIFNPRYLQLFQRMGELITGSGSYSPKARITADGDSKGALVTLEAREDFAGVVMPMRKEDFKPVKLPDWTAPPPPLVKVKPDPVPERELETVD